MPNVDKVVTNVDLIREEGVAVTATPLTSDNAANDTETLIITPTQPGYRMVLIINNVSAGGTLTVECAAGDYWFGKAMGTVSVLQETSVAIVFQAAAHKDKDTDAIPFVIHPVTGGKLVTTHAATWQCFQLPPKTFMTGL